MDYSLMVAVDEASLLVNTNRNLADRRKARKELVVGIIDVVRTYTWVSSKRIHPTSARLLIVTGQKAGVMDKRYDVLYILLSFFLTLPRSWFRGWW